jgi:hypothetical protein
MGADALAPITDCRLSVSKAPDAMIHTSSDAKQCLGDSGCALLSC